MWMRAAFCVLFGATLGACRADPPKVDPKPEPKVAPAPTGSAPAMPSDHAADLAKQPPPPTPPAGDPALGTCTFEIAGAVAAKETTAGGVGAMSLSYWSDAQQKQLMYADGEGMVLNCNGKDATLSFTTRRQSAEAFPFAPRKYAITKERGPKVLSFLGRAGKASFLGATGAFEVTAVDAKHMAGTFDLKVDVLGDGVKGEATIKGTFDMACPAHCK